ncbi:MAG: carbohydrate kinase family protein [Zoogloeaceae bacterium]|jgi:adenosine kinase|nr:carbohydrate kinase family protein [Zoogloeaceae bacterium]
MPHALICGSLAYDNIMVFPDRFKHHILPEQIHILNVSFLVPELRREFGGCAGNIAYNLKLLGGEPLIMATVGDDFSPYRQRLESLDLPLTHIRQVPGTFTAQAFITTDLDDNQITAFHPGAMNCSQQNRVERAENIQLGLVGPDGRAGMLQHARDFATLRIPFIFDPGQGLPLFDGEELLQFLALADYACFNDYEAQLAVERSGKSIEAIAQQVRALIVTSGAQGSRIHLPGRTLDIPCAQAKALIDPTGCGDAYRAGILYGILNHLDWEETGRLASLMGALKIENQGAQNHRPTRAEICSRYQQSFGTTIRL